MQHKSVRALQRGPIRATSIPWRRLIQAQRRKPRCTFGRPHSPKRLRWGDSVSGNSYANQAKYNPSVYETHNTQDLGVVSPDYNQAKLQGSVDSALVEALLQMLVGLAQNQGLPKYKLNEIIDFLKDFLSNGGSGGANGPMPVYGAPIQNDAVHLREGDAIKVGDKTVIADRPGTAHTLQFDPNTIYLQPGQSVTIGDTQVVADRQIATMPVDPGWGNLIQLPFAPAPAPVASAPVQQPGTISMSPAEFQSRFTVPTLMNDGSWTPTTNSVAEQAFGIPKGTPMSQVDLNNLKPLNGAAGTIISPVVAAPAPAPTPVSPMSSQAASSLQDAAVLMQKINSGTATKEDVNAFLSKLMQVAQSFAEAVGDSAASQSGARKAKKSVAAAAEGGVAGGGGDSAGVGSGTPGSGAVGAKGIGGTDGGAAISGAATSVGTSANYNPSQGIAPGFSGSTSGKSWLMAIAEAMGNVLGSKVQQMLTSSSKMASLTNDAKGIGAQSDAVNKELQQYIDDSKKPGNTFDAAGYETLKTKLKPQQDMIDNAMKTNGQEFTVESSKLQGASQEFSMLQNAFSNAIKSIGEGLGQLARKG